MAEKNTIRLSKVVKDLNVSSNTIIEFLLSKNCEISNNPNAKISHEYYLLLEKEFKNSADEKVQSQKIFINSQSRPKDIPKERSKKEAEIPLLQGTKKLGTKSLEELDLLNNKIKKSEIKDDKKTKPLEKELPAKTTLVKEVKKEDEFVKKIIIRKRNSFEKEIKQREFSKLKESPINFKQNEKVSPYESKNLDIPKKKKKEVIIDKVNIDGFKKLQGIKVLGSMDLTPKEPVKTITNQEKISVEEIKSYKDKEPTIKKKEKSIEAEKIPKPIIPKKKKKIIKTSDNDESIRKRLKSTISQMSVEEGKKTVRSKFKRQKRIEQAAVNETANKRKLEEKKIIKISEFAAPSEISSLLSLSVADVMSVCVSLGIMCSLNQRLEKDVIQLILEEFGFEANFVSVFDDVEIEDPEESLVERAPIVTVMGHVDHGKTTLLDYIQNREIAKKEVGGITQHIGAYSTTTKTGRKISFLDTPGHEAFTAMRARGAKITDIVVIIVAADDGVMIQTKEAISHAQAAGVPIIVAINKIDKEGANIDRVKEGLSQLDVLVEDWGGKYQCQEISARTGAGVEELLEKIILEADVLNLKANPNRPAKGTVVESLIKKGKGYVSDILIQKGTLKVGDIVVVGAYSGKVKALNDHLGKKLKSAGPSTPVEVIGIDGGAPQAGDTLVVVSSEREAKEIANKRQQFLRETMNRTKKHISLDEMNRRAVMGNFQEFNCIIKGDVDGSVEALADSIVKLSTDTIQVNIINKAVGPISESDVLLASASNAIIIGFQVRPNSAAKNLAEKENIKINLYSIIYDAIESIKTALEGLLSPVIKENIIATAKVLDTFNISKVGVIAGSLVLSGTIKKSAKIRVVRNEVAVFTGKIKFLKRFKDDVSEVKQGTECGIAISNFSDIKKGDIFEIFETEEIKAKL